MGPEKQRRQRLTIGEVMMLVAGVALGIWVVLPDLSGPAQEKDWSDRMLLASGGVLGGLSVVGVPLLLVEAWRKRRCWGAGKLLWFSSGMASWLLWPPVVYGRVRGQKMTDMTSGVCYFYGTPLMAIYVTSALLFGGWLRRRRRRRAAWSVARAFRPAAGSGVGMPGSVCSLSPVP